MPETPKKRIVKSAAAKPARAKKPTVKTSERAEPAADATDNGPAIIDVSGPEMSHPSETGSLADATGATAMGEAHVSGKDRYFEAVGRRKTAVARVRLYTRSGAFMINDKAYGDYFPTLDLQKIAEDALKKMKLWERFRVSARVSGGGIHAQAEAVRHGMARCLIAFNPDFRKRMKRAGFLKRDPRMKERKKFGLKKARKAPQWAKR